MKFIIFLGVILSQIVLFGFIPIHNINKPIKSTVIKSSSDEEKYYICSQCCKTKKAASTPWESGCKESSAGMHNYVSVGYAGDVEYDCRYCGATVYLISTSASPNSAISCCGNGGHGHSWVIK